MGRWLPHQAKEVVAEGAEAIVYVNGVRRVFPDGLAHLTLLQYLRDIGLKGTKLGCGEGDCGACTVMIPVSMNDSQHYAINAYLAPLYSVEGMHVITVDGVGDSGRSLHPIQGVLNTKAIHSSKAVLLGCLPPLFLAAAVLFAIKAAIMASRAEEGYHNRFPLDNPTTPERIRMAFIDNFTKQFEAPEFHPKLSI